MNVRTRESLSDISDNSSGKSLPLYYRVRLRGSFLSVLASGLVMRGRTAVRVASLRLEYGFGIFHATVFLPGSTHIVVIPEGSLPVGYGSAIVVRCSFCGTCAMPRCFRSEANTDKSVDPGSFNGMLTTCPASCSLTTSHPLHGYLFE